VGFSKPAPVGRWGRLIAEHQDWPTVVQLPFYTPGLNPLKASGGDMENGSGVFAARNLDQLAATVRN
jgi:hypothetical protein